VRRRWDIDERGHGVGDASRLVPEARALLERMDTPLWVTEDPDAHLLPHIARLGELEVVESRIDEDGTLVVDCRLAGAWDASKATTAAFAALGTVAETGTFIEKRQTAGLVELDVVTGVVPDDGPFATHGHTLLLRVRA
jgi:hypothetical protein